MLVSATTDALHALAHLTSTPPTGLAHTLPAFGADKHGPVRATSACHRCAARRGIHQAVPVRRPIHDKVCTRHGTGSAITASPCSTSLPAPTSSPLNTA
jgi:hypothetical protein